MSRPLAVDLCCGVGGWAAGLIAEGFDVVGFDLHRLEHPLLPRFPGQKVIADVRTLSGTGWRGKVDLICASPPCTEFSRRRMPFRHGRPELWQGEPDLSIVRACERIALEAGAPLVLENVRGAVPWLGRPAHRSGPFYLWGDGVPPLLPTIGPCKTRYYDPSAPPGTPPRNRFPRQHRNEVLRPALRAVVPLVLSRAVGRWPRQRIREGWGSWG